MKKIKVQTILREMKTSGHRPMLAFCDDFKKYVVKHDRGKFLCVINEFLSCFLLENFDLPFANCALVDVPTFLTKNNTILSSANQKTNYYNYLCFGSEWIEGVTDMSDIIEYDTLFYKKLDSPLAILHISLFDLWIENDDRKPTNYNLLLLQTNKYKVIPIDHSFIFESLSYNYLNPKEFYPKDNDHLLLSELGVFIKKQFEINERFIENERIYFFNCLTLCQKNFPNFITQLQNHYPLNQKDIENIYNFLFDKERNEKVFEEYIYRLKH